MEKSYLLCDSHHGVYSWQLTAKKLLEANQQGMISIPQKAWELLSDISNGPHTEDGDDVEDYWIFIEDIGYRPYVFKHLDGTKFTIEEHEGDLWAIAEGESFYDDEE